MKLLLTILFFLTTYCLVGQVPDVGPNPINKPKVYNKEMNGWQVLRTTNGNSCANAIPLVIDGVCRTYTPSSTIEPSYAICNYGSIGNVIYFSFTTNSSVSCIEADISTSVISQADVSLYRSCSPVIDYDTLALCLNDGRGVWSTKSSVGDNPLQPNTTYYLRVRTAQFFNGTINICAKYNTHTNYSCATATTITTMPLTDNNACAYASYTGSSANLCASSIENTAYYRAVYTNPANKFINIDLNCDNFDSQDQQTGFQVGLFRNSCSGLSIDCKNGYDSLIAFDMSFYPLGTVFYIIIDGMFNAKCKYTIWIGDDQILNIDSANAYQPVITITPNQIKFEKRTDVNVYDVSGRLLHRYKAVKQIETSGWKKQLYIIQTEYQTKKYLKL